MGRVGALTHGLAIGALQLGSCAFLLIMGGWLGGNWGRTWGLGISWRSAGKWVFECVLLERDGWGLMYGVDEIHTFKVFVRVK